jgi:hypothetical protein
MNKLVRLYRCLAHGAPIIIVSGLPRSGTSMLMSMLHAGGIELICDGQRRADEYNPKGYYEFQRVMGLAREPDKRWLRHARGKAIKVISTLLLELPRTNNYKVILVRRDLDEVLASQAKMLAGRGEMHAIDDPQMRQLFEDDLWRAVYLLEHAGHFDYLQVDYQQVFKDPGAQAQRIANFLGGNLDIPAMVGMVDDGLYRNRGKDA